MNEEEIYKLKFPIGQFEKPIKITNEHIIDWIKIIESFPKAINKLTKGLNNDQKNWKYRPNGWSIKQVVHHCSDSHINSLIRFKLTLTEDKPMIKPYYEDRWAELIDSTDNNIDNSIALLSSLHSKWTKLLKSLKEAQLKREFINPEHGQTLTLEENIGIYAWHCNHHFAHIDQAIKAEGRYNKSTST